ncbi:MAG: hypothetical protein ACPIOQ_06410, partial [Promethearchaeia archaeon]
MMPDAARHEARLCSDREIGSVGFRRRRRIPPLILQACRLLGSAALLYAAGGNGLHNPFVLDDKTKVLGNTDIRSLRNLPGALIYRYADSARRINRNDPSRPLTSLSFTLNYCLFGPASWHFRLVNLAAHLACAWSVRALLCTLLARPERPKRTEWVGLPDLTGVFFLTSPLAVGTASYVYARSEVASALMMTRALDCHIRTRQGQGDMWVQVAGWYACALGFKQTALSLPFLAVFCDVWLVLGEAKWPCLGRWRTYV